MPKFYKDKPLGYCLERELPFWDVPNVGRCQLSTAGSLILVCKTCGEEHFRSSPQAWCFKGHGAMVPLNFALSDELRPMLEKNGVVFTTLEDRKRERLANEVKRPWNFVFGNKTEADFPLGYAKESWR